MTGFSIGCPKTGRRLVAKVKESLFLVALPFSPPIQKPMNAIVIEAAGAPDVLVYRETPAPEIKPSEVLVRIHAAGVNFIDVYHRTGLYARPLPFTPGLEGAGVVEKVGSEVQNFNTGDRVAWCSVTGSYAELVAAPADKLVPVPDKLSFDQAAAAMLQGMTAHYLVTSTYPLRHGDTALIHAAAGGVGLLLIQMAKRAGAHVIGTVSTAEKEQLARDAGADDVIRYTQDDFETEVNRITHGRGVTVVYDSVGKDTFLKGFNVLAPRGMMVLFGQASGAIEAFNPLMLSQKGSLFLTRPTLGHYTATRDELLLRATDVMQQIIDGDLRLRLEHAFPLKDAQAAHVALEGRKTTGKVLLTP